MSTIGIIGGGQLGLMIAEAAHKLRHKVIGLDPTPFCPLSHEADEMIVASYDDSEEMERLMERSDIVTYEFENVNLELVDRHKDKIPQHSLGLRMSRHRLREKEFAQGLGIPTPQFMKLTDIKKVPIPSIIKTVTGGYDGKGQLRITQKSDIDQFVKKPDMEYIVEEYIPFDREISVLATRDVHGHVVSFPIPVNIHRNGILHISEIYADQESEIARQAIRHTMRLIQALDYVGTLAVEFFVVNGKVLFNEFAPRPHNSGHYTIEGCNVSQFENHVRAITGDALVEPVLIKPTVMINVLGQDKAYINHMDTTVCTLHDYRKTESRKDRKMAHITCTDSDVEALQRTARTILGGTP